MLIKPPVVVSAPDVEPVTLEDTKEFMHVTGNNENTRIEGLITTARLRCEAELGQAFITQTLDIYFDAFPSCIELPRNPVQGVTSITYYDSNGDLQTLATSAYVVDLRSVPARIIPARGTSWPVTEPDHPNAVVVEFVAGYGDSLSSPQISSVDSVPQNLKTAVMTLTQHLFDHPLSSDLPAAVRLNLFSDHQLFKV